MSGVAAALLVIGRRLDPRRALAHDVPLKAAAVGVTLLLWVAASQGAPREITAAFDRRVPVERPEVPAGYVLRAQLGDVSVRLRGPDAAVARVAITDLRATLDLAAVDAGRAETQDAPVRVAVAVPDVTVVDVQPATVPVRLERLGARTLTVQARFANQPPTGSQPGTATIVPPEVRVSGPESDLARAAAVYATVRFGDVAVDLSQSTPAVAVDAAGTPIEGLRAEPAGVQVSVPVLPTATTRTVPVLWSIRGAVAVGYWISQVTTDPVAVTVRGEQSALAPLERINAAPIDVTGLTATRSFSAPLFLPAGVAMLEPRDAVVTVTVVALQGTRPFPLVAIQVTGLRSEHVADLDVRTADVTLAGPVPTLAGLAATSVSATVDAAGRGPGVYQVDVIARGPAGTTVQLVQPARVTLTIRNRA